MKNQGRQGKEALDLIEEAVHTLWRAPLGVHVCYYTGSIPFLLALLYFWSDMSRGAFAYDRVAGGSLALALLYVWMKVWHSVSAAKLRGFLSGEPLPPWTPSRVARLALLQAAVQPSALFLRPAALLATLPYGWVRAFYENAVVLGGGANGLGELFRDAKRQAVLWPRQNHMALLYLSFFGVVAWSNIVILFMVAPYLLKIFTGIESAFTTSYLAYFNTTFLAASAACTSLCINPLTRAVYALRCFHGDSIRSGADLRLEMRRSVTALAAGAALLLLCAPASRGASAAEGRGERVDPAALEKVIGGVLKRDEFAWRMPRQNPPAEQEGFFGRFMKDSIRMFVRWMTPLKRWAGEWIQKFFEWLSRRSPREPHTAEGGFERIQTVLKVVMWSLCVVIAGLIGWMVWKNRGRLKRSRPVAAEVIAAAPDLASEEVTATQLPEEEWLKLAQEMAEKGDFRLALRALYLAALAHLGRRGLIAIARHKSNRDYERELGRRARARLDLLDAFGQSVRLFEGVWYGMRETNGEAVQRFSGYFEKLRAS